MSTADTHCFVVDEVLRYLMERWKEWTPTVDNFNFYRLKLLQEKE